MKTWVWQTAEINAEDILFYEFFLCGPTNRIGSLQDRILWFLDVFSSVCHTSILCSLMLKIPALGSTNFQAELAEDVSSSRKTLKNVRNLKVVRNTMILLGGRLCLFKVDSRRNGNNPVIAFLFLSSYHPGWQMQSPYAIVYDGILAL